MIRKSIPFALALSLALLAGCIQVRDEYTLNPDGSGKVKVSRLEPAGMSLMGGGKALDPDAEAIKVAKKLVEKSKGIDAWKDVSWKIARDGRIQVTGTAYFKDINKLAFGSKEGRARLEKLEGGKLVLLFGKGSGKAAAPAKGVPTEEPKKLSDEELKRKILVERMKWQQGRGMLVAMLSGMVMESTYNLPGKVGKASCFKKLGKNKVRFTIKGDDFLKVMNELTAKDEFWKAQATNKNRGSLENMDVPEALEKIYGSKEPPRVEVSGATDPLFDYAKEVAEARKTMAALMAKLSVKPVSTGTGSQPGKKPEPVAEPVKAGAALTGLMVTSIRETRQPDVPKGSGLYLSKPGCEIVFLARLPGKVLKIENGGIEKIVADDDSDLMLESKYSRKTSGIYLQGTRKDFVKFTVKTKPLPAGSKVIKLISGHMLYTVGSGAKPTDLGEIKLEKDATGSAMDAKITRTDKRFKTFSIQIKIKSDTMVKGFNFKTADGNAVHFKQTYSNGWRGKYTFSFQGTTDLPDKVKVELVLYEKTEKRQMPFKVENLKVR
jgi:hypothetical protein